MPALTLNEIQPLLDALPTADPHQLFELDCQVNRWRFPAPQAGVFTLDDESAILLIRSMAEITEATEPVFDPVRSLLQLLDMAPPRCLLNHVVQVYPNCPARYRSDVLGLLRRWKSPEGASALLRLTEDGFPDGGGAVLALESLMVHSDDLLPHALQDKGPGLEVVLAATARAMRLHGWTPAPALLSLLTETVSPGLVDEARAVRCHIMCGAAYLWRGSHEVRASNLASRLQIAANLDDAMTATAIRVAWSIPDTTLALLGVIGGLRRGLSPPERIIDRLAQRHSTRSELFRGLEAVGGVSGFPSRWRTWDDFAVSSLAEWLEHDGELPWQPSRIEVMHREELEQSVGLYLLRYRLMGTWYAGVSGPHTERGLPCPTHGIYTFSRYTRWSAMSPSEHIDACVGPVVELISRRGFPR